MLLLLLLRSTKIQIKTSSNSVKKQTIRQLYKNHFYKQNFGRFHYSFGSEVYEDMAHTSPRTKVLLFGPNNENMQRQSDTEEATK